MNVSIKFKPQDLWIGAYWEAETDMYRPYTYYRVYICLLPTLPIRISWRREVESFKKFKAARSDPSDTARGDVK